MNIKDAIERGLYPKDEKGRALVPMRNGRTATIYATDYATHPDDEFPLLAGYGREPDRWRADGQYYGGHESDRDLLPPPPRKVEVKAWGVMLRPNPGQTTHVPALIRSTRDEAERDLANWPNSGRVVELTGSYEEPWIK